MNVKYFKFLLRFAKNNGYINTLRKNKQIYIDLESIYLTDIIKLFVTEGKDLSSDFSDEILIKNIDFLSQYAKAHDDKLFSGTIHVMHLTDFGHTHNEYFVVEKKSLKNILTIIYNYAISITKWYGKSFMISFHDFIDEYSYPPHNCIFIISNQQSLSVFLQEINKLE